MHNDTRVNYEQYLSQLAQLNGVSSAEKQFAVTPSVQQTLEKRMQESSAFLEKVNIHGVREKEGEKIGLGVTGTIAARTDTTTDDRVPREMADLSSQRYNCQFTEYDTALRYSTLDQWAKFPDFQTKLRDAILRQQALDRIMVGFNGTHVATKTNRATYPMLQDVNKGWLQKYRDDKPENVMTEGADGADVVNVGDGGHYKNLDALIFDAVNNLIAPWHAERTDLVVVVGRQLLADKYFPLIDKTNPPTEMRALDLVISEKRLGGLQAVRAPFVPAGTALVTPLVNLSIYYQEGARRRHVQENPKRSRIENYESSNDDFVVEDYDAGCLIENITLVS